MTVDWLCSPLFSLPVLTLPSPKEREALWILYGYYPILLSLLVLSALAPDSYRSLFFTVLYQGSSSLLWCARNCTSASRAPLCCHVRYTAVQAHLANTFCGLHAPGSNSYSGYQHALSTLSFPEVLLTAVNTESHCHLTHGRFLRFT